MALFQPCTWSAETSCHCVWLYICTGSLIFTVVQESGTSHVQFSMGFPSWGITARLLLPSAGALHTAMLKPTANDRGNIFPHVLFKYSTCKGFVSVAAATRQEIRLSKVLLWAAGGDFYCISQGLRWYQRAALWMLVKALSETWSCSSCCSSGG